MPLYACPGKRCPFCGYNQREAEIQVEWLENHTVKWAASKRLLHESVWFGAGKSDAMYREMDTAIDKLAKRGFAIYANVKDWPYLPVYNKAEEKIIGILPVASVMKKVIQDGDGWVREDENGVDIALAVATRAKIEGVWGFCEAGPVKMACRAVKQSK